MPFDRIATLRNAVKLLRHGKLVPAIAEYVRVVEDDPRDWATANTLGDLYVRAQQLDKAIEQFMRIADSLGEEGDFAKAGALYKKILKLKPDDEHALLQSAEIASSQGLLADARAHLNGVIERRRARNDARGAAQIRARLGSLDPADLEARIAAASARVELGDAPGAVRDLKEIASELIAQDRLEDAIAALREAALLNQSDEDIRSQLLKIYVAAGDFSRARESAATVEQLTTLAAAMESHGAGAEALETLRQAARLPAANTALKARVAREYLQRGEFANAAEFLNDETAGADVPLLLAFAEIRLRGDRWDEGVGLLRRLLREDPTRHHDIGVIALKVADQHLDAGFGVVELLIEPAVKRTDWPGAATTLQEFVARAPNYLPALMRLIEVCVDGGLESEMYAAQAQLADAYIAAGAGTEARFIAEDLVAREPWEQGHIDRFRRALILLGEPDPDAVIADRLSGDSPFTSIDRVLNSDELFPPLRLEVPKIEAEPPPALAAPPTPVAVAAVETPPARAVEIRPARAVETPPARAVEAPPARTVQEPAPAAEDRDQFALGPGAIDLGNLLDADVQSESVEESQDDVEGEIEIEVEETLELDDDDDDDGDDGDDEEEGEEEVEVDLEAEELGVVLEEVDLSALLDEIAGATTVEAKGQSYGLTAGDLVDLDGAEAFYRRGAALEESGDIEGCIAAFEAASKAPAWRFAAGARLGRVCRQRGQMPRAIEWFDRALTAGAPSGVEGREVRYDLADVLESSGDKARALVVSIQSQADAGEYRDIAVRIDRLTKLQSRG